MEDTMLKFALATVVIWGVLAMAVKQFITKRKALDLSKPEDRQQHKKLGLLIAILLADTVILPAIVFFALQQGN